MSLLVQLSLKLLNSSINDQNYDVIEDELSKFVNLVNLELSLKDGQMEDIMIGNKIVELSNLTSLVLDFCINRIKQMGMLELYKLSNLIDLVLDFENN